jgi:hypothetical protein
MKRLMSRFRTFGACSYILASVAVQTTLICYFGAFNVMLASALVWTIVLLC